IKDNFKKICKNQNISMSNRLNFLIIDFLSNFKIENKIDNIHKHITVWEIMKILLKKIQLVFKRFNTN
ncbi:hypothetical protein, partial [uncultured Planktosalinus sp.]|uniref:hypothetical protein n=1 Tax=uncultured Planktosalinus sp. TaxID=1810935 RepID=UPI0030DAD701